MSQEQKKRNGSIDFLRILATLMIVTAHITVIIYNRPDFFGKPFWWANHLILSVCRLGTPIFFMISGYLLATKKRTITETVRHTLTRLIIPFLIFIVISDVVFSTIHSTAWFDNLIPRLFNGGGNYLYFLPGLAILYLINPIIQKITATLSQKELRYSIVFLLGNTALFTLGEYLLSSNGNVHTNIFVYWILTLGFFLFGHYIKLYPHSPVNRKQILVILASLFLMNSVGTFILLSLSYGALASYLQSYLGITVIVASVYLFKLIMAIPIRPFKTIAENCFGVYLVHMIILEYFLYRTPLTIDRGPFNPAIMVVLIWFCLVGSSFVVSFIGGKIFRRE